MKATSSAAVSCSIAASTSFWAIFGNSSWVPPAVAAAFTTLSACGSSPCGTITIVLGSTFPAVPGSTAVTVTFLRPGNTVSPTRSARGTVIVAAVRNRTPALVLTMLPDGMVLLRRKSRFENLTTPFAAVSSMRAPVAGKVSSTVTSKETIAAGITSAAAIGLGGGRVGRDRDVQPPEGLGLRRHHDGRGRQHDVGTDAADEEHERERREDDDHRHPRRWTRPRSGLAEVARGCARWGSRFGPGPFVDPRPLPHARDVVPGGLAAPGCRGGTACVRPAVDRVRSRRGRRAGRASAAADTAGADAAAAGGTAGAALADLPAGFAAGSAPASEEGAAGALAFEPRRTGLAAPAWGADGGIAAGEADRGSILAGIRHRRLVLANGPEDRQAGGRGQRPRRRIGGNHGELLLVDQRVAGEQPEVDPGRRHPRSVGQHQRDPPALDIADSSRRRGDLVVGVEVDDPARHLDQTFIARRTRRSARSRASSDVCSSIAW